MGLLASSQISFLFKPKCSAMSEYSFERLLPKTPTSSVCPSQQVLTRDLDAMNSNEITYAQSNWTPRPPPPPKMMVPKRPRDHLRVHIAAQAELQSQLPPHNLLLHRSRYVDHVADAVRLVREQRPELAVGGRLRGLGEMDGALQAVGAGFAEGGREEGDVPGARVAAEVDAHDTASAVLAGELDDGERGGEVVAAVDGEDEVGLHGVGGVEGGYAVQDGLDVVVLGYVGRGDSPRSGAQLEIDDAVGVEVLEDGGGGVGEGGAVIAEVVDVA
jgi:hypothetical protein